jgi:glucose/mannose-6-phosphate isomerase
MLRLLHNSSLINIEDKEIKEAFEIISNTKKFKEDAKKLSAKIKNKIPIIYSSNLFASVGYRLKTQFNENSKWPAFSNSFPEINHNEILSLKNLNKNDFILIFIKDKKDNPKIKKSMELYKKMFGKKINILELETKGQFLLTRTLSVLYLGDFISYYLAIDKKTDPTPVLDIESFKKFLRKN